MKVIDLLNKRANGEEVPKKIRIEHWCYKFEWVEHLGNYYDKASDIDLTSAISMNEELNYKVHILDEEDEFIDIEEITIDGEKLDYGGLSKWLGSKQTDNEVKLCSSIECLGATLNDLIKNQKKMINKLNLRDF
jgi:hypothetical protein